MIKRTTDEWHQLFSAQQHSGQSAAAFCHERGLCAKHFIRRRKQLLAKPPVPAFVPVRVAPTKESVGIELHLGDALVLMLPSSLAPAWLAELIRQLRP